MSELKTKYSVGDAVFHASTHTIKKRQPCPDCLGKGKWKATSPAGGEYEFSCPRCHAVYGSNDALSLEYAEYRGASRRLTVGSVRVDTNDEHPVSYMCVETGVGSGSIYHEEDLFATSDEAQAAADATAVTRTATVPWVVKLYDKSLSLSDYQIENAELKSARDLRARHLDKIRRLFFDLRGVGDDVDEVERIVKEFKLGDDE